jgi:hypothetical protein
MEQDRSYQKKSKKKKKKKQLGKTVNKRKKKKKEVIINTKGIGKKRRLNAQMQEKREQTINMDLSSIQFPPHFWIHRITINL